MATLPPYFENMSPLRYDWFPTRAQCFIYRNWEMLSPARLARVLSADEETVCRMAADMGLGESTANEELWLTRGYVTLIRANWHLLTYPQLCTLLDWDEERLAFMLKEDDFLDVKLGRAKPCVPTLAIEALDGDGQKRTAAIRRVTEELRGKLPAPRISPFAFSEVYPKDIAPLTGRSRLGSSYLCAYEALYGRGINLVFLKEPHINTETYRKTMENSIQLTGGSVDLILEGVNKYLMVLAKEQIRLAFLQSEKEVEDMRQRTREGIETARLDGKQIGRQTGAKVVTKKSIRAKEIIRKYARDFGGILTDAEVMTVAKVSKDTYYKYKRELKGESNG